MSIKTKVNVFWENRGLVHSKPAEMITRTIGTSRCVLKDHYGNNVTVGNTYNGLLIAMQNLNLGYGERFVFEFLENGAEEAAVALKELIKKEGESWGWVLEN